MKGFNTDTSVKDRLIELFEQKDQSVENMNVDIVALFKKKFNVILEKKSSTTYFGYLTTNGLYKKGVVIEKDFHNSRLYCDVELCAVKDSQAVDYDAVNGVKNMFEKAISCYNFKIQVRDRIYDTPLKDVICLSFAIINEDD